MGRIEPQRLLVDGLRLVYGLGGLRLERVSSSCLSSPTIIQHTSSFSCPGFDLRPQPQARAFGSEVHDRPRHVWVAPLVCADCVALSESEERCDALRVDQVLAPDQRSHEGEVYSS